MSTNVTGPYQVDDETIERHETIDPIDLGAWYILINGAMQFVENKQQGEFYRDMLNKLN